jgi:branched-chain amino acid transport system ATP-binding protein
MTTPNVPALEIKDLHAWYGESHILHGVDLTVNRGEVVTLLGRNGAGRTTTMRAIMGLTGARKGSIKINGNETIGLPTHKIAHYGIGYCPEERDLLVAVVRGKPAAAAGAQGPGRQRHERGRDLRDVPEPERRQSQGTRLSGGEQQMLAVGRILRTGANLLLLDEISKGWRR